MGITIHFQGKLRNEQCFSEAVRIAEEYATRLKWPSEKIAEDQMTLLRVRGSFPNEEEWDYTGPVRGVALFPHEDCEPVRLEFDEDLYVQEYTKTQFAGPDVHISVITLLRSLEPLFEELGVIDEGEFWESNDSQQLKSHINRCHEVIVEGLAKDPAAKYKFKLPDGKIIDLMH